MYLLVGMICVAFYVLLALALFAAICCVAGTFIFKTTKQSTWKGFACISVLFVILGILYPYSDYSSKRESRRLLTQQAERVYDDFHSSNTQITNLKQ